MTRVTAGALLVLSLPALAAQPARTAEWLYDRSHYGEARALLQQRIAANPNDADAHAWLARIHVVTRDLKSAIASAERAVALAPKSVAGHLALAEALGEEAESANLFRQIPMARRIRRALETAVQLEPDNIPALGGLMQYYELAPGVVGGDKKKADQMLARIASLNPVEGYLRAAWLLSRRKQADQVEGQYLKALAVDPNHAMVRVNLAQLYSRNPARTAEAEAHAKALLKIDPAFVTPYQVLAIVYARTQRWQELDAILAQSDLQHPANFVPALAAARTLAASDRARALRYYQRYLSIPPELGSPSHAEVRQEMKKTGG